MEQFEEWWNTSHPIYDAGNDTVGVYNQNKAGWIAALKWALSLNSVRVHADVYEDIKKEVT